MVSGCLGGVRGTEVNSVENNNPSLVEPLAAEPEPVPDQDTLI